MKCEECRELLIAYVKKELADPSEVEAHLNQCTACVRELEDTRTVLEMVDEACQPAIYELVHRVILKAHEEGATEISITPTRGQVMVRFRKDGTLEPKLAFEAKAHRVVLARLKMFANLSHLANYAQSGNFTIVHEKETYIHTLTTVPAVNGEVALIRIIKGSQSEAPLDALGIDEQTLTKIDEKINEGKGLVVLAANSETKTHALLYALAHHVQRRDWQIVVIEKQVEKIIDDTIQLQPQRGKPGATEETLENALLLSPDAIYYLLPMTEVASFWSSSWFEEHLAVASLVSLNVDEALEKLRALNVDPMQLTLLFGNNEGVQVMEDISVVQ